MSNVFFSIFNEGSNIAKIIKTNEDLTKMYLSFGTNIIIDNIINKVSIKKFVHRNINYKKIKCEKKY